MIISILIPTRQRTQRLEESIRSLESTVALAELEILLALDDDDVESITWLEAAKRPNCRALVGPRVGYLNLHRYINALAQQATGKWLMLWNDDALMQTEHWDQIISGYGDQMVVLNPDTNHDNHSKGQCIFAIFPKSFVEIIGHVAQSNHYDTYVEWIANSLGIRRDVHIYVMHDRPDLTGIPSDSIYDGRQYTTEQFFGQENRDSIARDARRLAESLKRERDNSDANPSST